MQQFEPISYSVNDYLEWHERGQLTLSPKFQRREVWSTRAKSYLMDSIIRGKPFPKVLLREHLSGKTRKTIREVVDGQQRLRAIIEFVDGAFRVSRVHNRDFAGRYFAQLPDDTQRAILTYRISTDCLQNISDEEVRDIFVRLNTYGVKLNRMELLNAEFYGDFKTSSFKMGNKFSKFWLDNRVFSESQISRMGDAELAGELLAVLADGIQDTTRLKTHFRDWDDTYPSRPKHERSFFRVMDCIGAIFDDDLAQHEFRRPVLFYSLFCSVAHMQYGVPRMRPTRVRIPRSRYSRVRATLSEVDRIWSRGSNTTQEEGFYIAATRATTHQKERETRATFLCGLIRRALG